jgi:hypothetical protein
MMIGAGVGALRPGNAQALSSTHPPSTKKDTTRKRCMIRLLWGQAQSFSITMTER